MRPLIEALDPDTLAWKPIEGFEGLWQKYLSVDEETGDYSRLLKLAPGFSSDVILAHDFCEETMVISGSVRDHTAGITMKVGHYSHLPPGTEHGPYSSEECCIVFEIHFGMPQ
ncbi:MAG: hypothetical protein CMM46_13830 [Rhodospirillaceae bacterium]|nr:hypothetical protein [Rhodospirillaceae bacterium]|tara:strand:- start:9528 stop:9866 length:339 start_codon:yes stop_codon:yes gene_type:complete